MMHRSVLAIAIAKFGPLRVKRSIRLLGLYVSSGQLRTLGPRRVALDCPLMRWICSPPAQICPPRCSPGSASQHVLGLHALKVTDDEIGY